MFILSAFGQLRVSMRCTSVPAIRTRTTCTNSRVRRIRTVDALTGLSSIGLDGLGAGLLTAAEAAGAGDPPPLLHIRQ
jgi:hypothetical protein